MTTTSLHIHSAGLLCFGLGEFAQHARTFPDGLLFPGAVSEWEVAKADIRAQCCKAIRQAKLDLLAGVDHLIQCAARGPRLLGKRLALIDRELEIVGFELVHTSRIPWGMYLVNTHRSFTCG